MNDHSYTELDAQRETLVTILEGVGFVFFIAVMVAAWFVVPA